MNNYQIVVDPKTNNCIGIRRNPNGDGIPLDPANTDYQQFKKDIMAGGELQDADGVVMTDAQEFVRSLP